MANLKELRTRIDSVKSTMQITSAMKMVSAAKLKRAQDAITAMRPYAEKLREVIDNVVTQLDEDFENDFTKTRSVQKVLIVAMSSNKGLCGAFNARIAKQTTHLIEQTYGDVECEVYALGKKISEFVQKRSINTYASNIELFDKLTSDGMKAIGDEIIESYKQGSFDKVVVVYSKFLNPAKQEVVAETLLPFEGSYGDSSDQLSVKTDYGYEPNAEEMMNSLIPKVLQTQLFKSAQDSLASEHGARMTAMHKATDNAGELKGKLSLQYNRQRQAAITNEILEIVGGANALG